MTALLPLAVLVLLLVAPRRNGRPVGRATKILAVFLAIFFTIAILLGEAWHALWIAPAP